VDPPDVARRLFAPLASDYERWARILSLGQDVRWRRALVEELALPPGSLVLDLAAGTGQISRMLAGAGHRVVASDQSLEMLRQGSFPGPIAAATAERLPFGDGDFDGATFGYLLRYVDSVPGCLREIARVVRPGGRVAMVEFGRPRGAAHLPWVAYTRAVLPLAGAAIGGGWRRVGRFLGPSISDFSARFPPAVLARAWEGAGLAGVHWRRMSLGGGLVMWGTRS
jgi:demethylmenaquinone methyltransferase/2-methoxy-6-polyprenyl-1,4-benzoquinol methylase